MMKFADVLIEMTVSFEDDGETDLKEQAIERAMEIAGSEHSMQVVGEVRDTEFPTR